jgi:hypothetical protein
MNWLALILKWFPTVLQLVTEVQNAIPTAPGVAKQSFVLAMLQPSAEEKDQVAGLINTTVTNAQVAGIMAKDQPVAGATK